MPSLNVKGHLLRGARVYLSGPMDFVASRAAEKQSGWRNRVSQVLQTMGALEAQQAMAGVPLCDAEELAGADAILFGAPTRYGNMCGQMRQFLDGTGSLWARGALIGKVGSVFTSSATQHGGQESTILSFHTTLLHHGMVVVGLPYAFAGQMRIDEITGCSPYGASTIAGGKGERLPSENELAGARFQGRHVAQIAQRLRR